MNTLSRRTFVRQSGAASLALAAPAILRASAEREKLNIAIIGPGGMGSNHVRTLCKRADVNFAWVCDVDSKRAATAAKTIEDGLGQTPKVTKDLRAILDDRTVQAVFIATPDHWHAPAAILAANAGKHVYVEKPCSHNVREGRLMIEAAARNRIVMQVGTQSRSTPHVIQAMEKLRAGVIGEVLVAKAWNSQLRANQGHRPNSEPPEHLDYELWLGPVPKVPFKATYHPAHWRWFYHFGAGDFGNDGVHDTDIARWGLGLEVHPNRISALGSKLFFDDDQEWPDTLYCAFEYDLTGGKKKQLVYEQRIWSPYVQEGHENGCAWYGTEGMMVGGKASGWQIYGRKNKLIEEIKANGVDLAAHHNNFFACIRNGGGKANAAVETHHFSSSLCHLGNIAVRTGRTLHFDPAGEKFVGDPDATKLLGREYREHWAAPRA